VKQTAPPRPRDGQQAAERPVHAAYMEHLARCRAWCWRCQALAKDADIEDGTRLGWPPDERAAGGTR
jgi:hypothetical protein